MGSDGGWIFQAELPRAVALTAVLASLTACAGSLPATLSPAISPPPSAATSPAVETKPKPSLISPEADIDWMTYRNREFGFAFEYPSAYDSIQAQTHCGLWEEAQANGIVVHWGARSTLAVFPSLGASADDLLKSRLSQDAVNVEMTAVTASGVPGLKATFRFGGLGRYGEIYAFESMGRGFAASFTSGPGCEPADFPLLEAAAFDHAVQSLSIDP